MTLALFALALAWDASGLDLPLAHLAGSANGFPWRDHWLLSGVLHEGGRRAAWLLAFALCLAVWWPRGPFARITLGTRLRFAVSALLGALAVSLLKVSSGTSCPWELSEFGGIVPYASHWSLRPDGGVGHCFPAGHASSGFSFLGGYFAFRGHSQRQARLWLTGAAAAGLVFGLAQQWRGAHFMSHTLWSAVVCWTVAWAVHTSWPRAVREEGA
ncbi:MAG TPA: phosphatase PAP2 family protein [Ramlibacter sp.]